MRSPEPGGYLDTPRRYVPSASTRISPPFLSVGSPFRGASSRLIACLAAFLSSYCALFSLSQPAKCLRPTTRCRVLSLSGRDPWRNSNRSVPPWVLFCSGHEALSLKLKIGLFVEPWRKLAVRLTRWYLQFEPEYPFRHGSLARFFRCDSLRPSCIEGLPHNRSAQGQDGLQRYLPTGARAASGDACPWNMGQGILGFGAVGWYDKRSPFCKALRGERQPPTLIRRFRWSGENSVSARARAAECLRSQLSDAIREQPQASHWIVAHSHGGDVALRAATENSVANGLAGIICLSTPFLAASVRPWVKKEPGATVDWCMRMISGAFPLFAGIAVVGRAFLIPGDRPGLTSSLVGIGGIGIFIGLVMICSHSLRRRLWHLLYCGADSYVRHLEMPPPFQKATGRQGCGG